MLVITSPCTASAALHITRQQRAGRSPTHRRVHDSALRIAGLQSAGRCPTYTQDSRVQDAAQHTAGQQSAGRIPTHRRAAECRTEPYTPQGSRLQDAALPTVEQQSTGRCPTHRRVAEYMASAALHHQQTLNITAAATLNSHQSRVSDWSQAD